MDFDEDVFENQCRSCLCVCVCAYGLEIGVFDQVSEGKST